MINQEERWRRADEEVRKRLAPGVKLRQTLRGHTGYIGRIAWSPDGRMLASPSYDHSIRLWDAETGDCVGRLTGHLDKVWSVAFEPRGSMLVSASHDGTVKFWDVARGALIRTIEAHDGEVWTVAFHPTIGVVASGSNDATIKIWDVSNGKLLWTLRDHRASVNCLAFSGDGHYLGSGSLDKTIKLWEFPNWRLVHSLAGHQSSVLSVAFDPTRELLASGNQDETVKLWEPKTGKLLRSLEGHTATLNCVAISSVSGLLASKSSDGSVRLWRSDTGECVATILHAPSPNWAGGVAFHPRLPLLATVGVAFLDSEEGDCALRIWELDPAVLAGQSASSNVTYVSAKIVLVGDSGVGKTGLGWRLAHGEFKEHSSTHGQQFWLLNQFCKQRNDGARCEAVLWDLAGQPDYRLIHALLLDDADLALVIFDPTRDDDPLSGVEFWLRQLKVGKSDSGGTPTLLIAARCDRGTPRLTREELEAYCRQHGVASYLATSAKAGEGIEELIQQVQGLIPWDRKAATVTSESFKRIKGYVLDLKESARVRDVILTLAELRQRLEASEHEVRFSDAEMITAIGHLTNHGYVTRLRASQGELRVLLAPELLNNLAASFIIEARRNQKGLGSLEERAVLSRGYRFPELEMLTKKEQDILLDSVAGLFIERNVCFRETDPLNGCTYLVFPELINLRKPVEDADKPMEDGIAYTVGGAVENVYASLVVLMGYTQTFTRTNQWRNQARYEVGKNFVCGFRLEDERPGELDFVLDYSVDTPPRVRTLFQCLFENFLARRNLMVQRVEPMTCPDHHLLNRAVVRERMSTGAEFAFCSQCGKKIPLPKADRSTRLTERQSQEVEANRRAADNRSRFEQVLFRLKTFAGERNILAPECFISYAWGNPIHERWVENNLATDLQKAGITVMLDRWENARIGASVPRFVERIGRSHRVIVVGTPGYREKYENAEPMRGFVVAAEGDLIGNRMIGTEKDKESVLPVLLEGTAEAAFPTLLRGRVYADFRENDAYFDTAFGLILSLYQIQPRDPVVTALRAALDGQKPA